MHLIVAHAVAPNAEAGAGMSSWRARALPNLRRVLERWAVVHEDRQERSTLNTPDERAVARALQWNSADGQLPLAAWQMQAPPGQSWGLLTPCHWSASAEYVRLADPNAMELTAQQSHALFESVRDLWLDDGFEVVWRSPLAWYVSHPMLADMPCASLDRVVGRQVDAWLGQDSRLRAVRRLQSEVQMVWHAHPVNQQREQQGLPAINSVWLSGCGVLHQAGGGLKETFHWDVTLRDAAWRGDMAAWQAAFEALDLRIARWYDAESAPELQRLTLCGEHGSRTWQPPVARRFKWPGWRQLLGASPSPWDAAWEGL